ncbi:MAG: ATP-dependent helicase RecG [Frankiales bacterium]|nr:ATP-dependent helicase RecG [Frankiales bacterium]
MVSLDAKLSAAVGGPTAKALGTHLELHTVGDLLRHYPRRYVERGALTPFLDLVEGEHATVFAEVQGTTGKRLRPNLYKTDVVIRDAEGARMTLAVFNKPWIEKDLRAGRRAYFSGKAERFNGRMQLANPEFQLVDDEAGVVAEEFAGTLLPIYPAAAKVASLTVQRSVRVALDVVDLGPDPLPDELRARHRLLGLAEALRLIHQPTSYGDVTRAQKRLKWDEAFVLQVVLAQRRAVTRSLAGTPRAPRPGGLLEAFDAALPFSLTAGQQQVGRELAGEMSSSSPMYRLLQGEVGSGKTVVALRAMLQVVDSGGQAALLAPTEVLAQQHARSLRAMLGPLAQAGELGAADVATRIALLTGSQGAAARRTALAEAASGEAGIVVGTHALLSEGVAFADLGLVVVDEQHRFGVEQRDALRAKGSTPPHVLVMTATPIPRTIAMTVYGDLEVSTLTELPKGRSPIKSAVVPVGEKPAWLDTAWQRVREQVAEGRQAFVVTPRIGGEEEPAAADGKRPAAAVLDVLPLLQEGPLQGLRVAALHGRMPPEDKDAVMQRFTAGQLDVLVATTVIEVGVDVPNATVMVVLDADRFGVSQLHQLRGRVGRGAHAALCLLVTEAEGGSPSRERLEAVAGTNDGFELSRIDLEQRREGDVLGASQSGGRSSLRMLRLADHEELILEARAEAVRLVADDPALRRHPALAQAVVDVLDEERAEFLAKG